MQQPAVAFTKEGPSPAPRTAPPPRLGYNFTGGIYESIRSFWLKKESTILCIAEGGSLSPVSDPAKLLSTLCPVERY